jgi:hypothetical protein
MTATELSIFLLTCFDAEGKETERLVEAESRAAAVNHGLKVNKASAADVARVMGAGGKIEKAE